MTAATTAATVGGHGQTVALGRPADDRPVRFTDPARNAAYWARVDAIVASAPPLDDSQRAVIRTAFSTVTTERTQEAA